MKQYNDLVRLILETGIQTPNRTGVDAITIPGAMTIFQMKDGFPASTGKRLAFKSVVAELCGFYRAATSAETFRNLGCKVWDKNANDPGVDNSNGWLRNAFRKGEDDLGPVYGAQWREWQGFKWFDVETAPSEELQTQLQVEGWEAQVIVDGHQDTVGYLYRKSIDQLGDAIRTVIKNPDSRRILFHGWNPAVLDEVALPACHLLYQLLPNKRDKILNMVVYVRSNDIALGKPFNDAQAAASLHFISRITGYTPGSLTMFIADAHIYVDAVDYLKEQISNEPYPLPTLELDARIPDCSHDPEEAVAWLNKVEPEDFRLLNYKYHTLKTPVPGMAV